ncbi:hypothetical protein D3C78_1162890 [compost metagenome]
MVQPGAAACLYAVWYMDDKAFTHVRCHWIKSARAYRSRLLHANLAVGRGRHGRIYWPALAGSQPHVEAAARASEQLEGAAGISNPACHANCAGAVGNNAGRSERTFDFSDSAGSLHAVEGIQRREGAGVFGREGN